MKFTKIWEFIYTPSSLQVSSLHGRMTTIYPKMNSTALDTMIMVQFYSKISYYLSLFGNMLRQQTYLTQNFLVNHDKVNNQGYSAILYLLSFLYI